MDSIGFPMDFMGFPMDSICFPMHSIGFPIDLIGLVHAMPFSTKMQGRMDYVGRRLAAATFQGGEVVYEVPPLESPTFVGGAGV